MRFSVFVFFISLSQIGFAQKQIRLVLGGTKLKIDERFKISVLINDSEKRTIPLFPTLPNFEKEKLSTKSEETVEEGRIVHNHTIIQYYIPKKEGKFKFPSYAFKIDGQTYNSEAFEVEITKSGNIPSSSPSLEDFSKSNSSIFITLQSSKNSIRLNEEFIMSLTLFVSKENPFTIQFNELNDQLKKIIARIRPKNCWEYDFEVGGVLQGKPVVVGGKQYTSYTLYKAAFYPFVKEDIIIPSISMDFTLSSSQKNTLKNLQTLPQKIEVNALPPHPNDTKALAGVFEFYENQSDTLKKATGKKIRYICKISGFGNPDAVQFSHLKSDENIDFQLEKRDVQTYKTDTYVKFVSQFEYNIRIKKPLEIPLEKYISWIYFNIQTQKYDTLHSKVILKGEGREITHLATDSEIYENTMTETEELFRLYSFKFMNRMIPVLLLVFIGLGIYLFHFFKKS